MQFSWRNFLNYNFGFKIRVDMPFAVGCEVTNFCNLNCPACNYSLMKRPKQHMHGDLFKKIVDELSTFKNFKIFDLQMWGEPLLNPDIFKMIDYASNRVPHVRLSTNATLLDDRTALKLIEHPPHSLVISIDAAKSETYNKMRTGGNYSQVINNTKHFLYLKGKQRLPYTIVQLIETKINQNEIEEFKKIWTGLADFVCIRRLSSLGNINKVFDNLKVKDYSANFKFTCCTLWSRMYIYSNGDVPFCGNDVDGLLCLGNVKNQSIAEIWNSKNAVKIRKILRINKNLPKECINCKERDMGGALAIRHILSIVSNKIKNKNWKTKRLPLPNRL